jgi:hypothetical protein
VQLTPIVPDQVVQLFRILLEWDTRRRTMNPSMALVSKAAEGRKGRASVAGPVRNRSLSDQHPKLTVAFVVTGMIAGLLLGPTQIEFWAALLLLAIFAVGYWGHLRN